jgi:hypothetical protein
MPEASQRMVHQEDGSCVWEAAQHGVLRGSATSSMLSKVQTYEIRPRHFCFSFPHYSCTWLEAKGAVKAELLS